MNEGWIKIHRKILDWEWYDDINTKVLFIHLLLKANHQGKSWHGVKIERGQTLTGRKKLAEETKLTEQQIRTSLTKLKSTNEITIKSTNLYSLITINSYNDYQVDNQQSTKRVTKEQPTSNHKQECKKEKNDKNSKSEKVFSDEVRKLSDFLYECIKLNNDTFKGSPRKWDSDMDKILRIDKRPYEEVAKLIQLAQEDSFWRSNILSGSKLREKYDQLYMKLSKKANSTAFIS